MENIQHNKSISLKAYLASRLDESSVIGQGPAIQQTSKKAEPGMRLVSREVYNFCNWIAESFEIGKDILDITDRFFLHIEKDSIFLEQYRILEKEFGAVQLNSQVGRWIKAHYNLASGEVVPAKLSKLITAYTTHSFSNPDQSRGTAAQPSQ